MVEENKIPEFEKFIAIDWSGAVRNYDGIAVAICQAGRSAPTSVQFSDHDTDALLSAAGLRMIAGDPDVWTPAEWRSPRVQREGWIFGVR